MIANANKRSFELSVRYNVCGEFAGRRKCENARNLHSGTYQSHDGRRGKRYEIGLGKCLQETNVCETEIGECLERRSEIITRKCFMNISAANGSLQILWLFINGGEWEAGRQACDEAKQ